ncbi:hypothetical protein [Actinotalea sp. Marseille-Q4924]|uniref:hypothetical protein n=1 Tax=Actinotalea sp. Marseille-Q4924 TaxID=2866571 RepID=UPI001CE45ECD|nr:hypothetical protein [Actinotalea sp. Marseille-Q4924]
MDRSTRTIAVLAVTAVVSLGAGLGLGRMVQSPAEAAAAASPPDAGLITVPVEMRSLTNDVVLRGDVLYEDPVQVVLETGDLGGPAVVTGQVPEPGATIAAGDVLLEVAGRPVVALAGQLPVYRTLRAGVSGPDVVQLKEALAALGIDAGDVASPVYDARAAAGVEALYARVGYPAPTAGDDVAAAVESAREGVRATQDQLTQARADLARAQAGGPRSEQVRLQADVDSAQYRLETARAACATPAPEVPCDRGAVIDAEGTLAVAIAARAEGQVAPDTATERSAVQAAERAVGDAQSDLADALTDAMTPLPAGEVVYLDALPRRVDGVEVRRGSTVGGSPVMSVSGATLQVVGTVPAADAALLTVDAPAVIQLPDGAEVPGTVAQIGGEDLTPAAGGGEEGGDDAGAAQERSRTRVVVVPGELTEDQRLTIQGANVRITVPVGSTAGDVLAVPIAALDTGAAGEARVEVVADDGSSEVVVVRTGLAAGGYVEVSAVDGALEQGDRVSVGVAAAGADADEDTSGEDAPEDEA